MIQELSVLQQAAQGSPPLNVEALVVGGLISAAFGALTGWLSAYLKVKAESRATKEEFRAALERLEQNTRTVGEVNAEIARRAGLDAELRAAVREFTAAAGSLIHSMCWLGWDCVARRRVDDEMVKSYDKEVHELAPKLVSQLAVIAMLNRDVHARLSGFADDIFALDLTLSEAIVGEQGAPGSQRTQLQTCYEDGYTLERRFRQGVSELFHYDRSETGPVGAGGDA